MARFSLAFLFLFVSIINAQIYPDSLVDNYLKTGINFILVQNYAKAEKNFTQLKTEYPQLPLGNIYLAAAEIAKSLDYYEPFDENLIFSYLDSATEISEKRFDEDDTLIWNSYFKALTEGYYAYFQAMRGNYFSALTKGFNSIHDFQSCLNKNPNFYEAFIAIGAFDYWSSSKSLGFNWLPFVKGNGADGIKILERAISKPTYNKYLAAYSLCWIYIDNKMPKKSVELAKNILKEYPNSRLFTWVLADAYKRFDKKKAIENYEKVLNTFVKNSDNSKVVKIILRHKIAMLQYNLKEYNKSLNLCNNILEERKTLNSKQHYVIDERLNRVVKLKNRILKNIK